MLKKKLHIKLGLFIGVSLYSISVQAQLAITLPESNIQNRTDYQQTFPAGNYTALINLLPAIRVKANTATFNNTSGGSTTIPLNQLHIKIASIGNISLISTSTEVPLTTAYQDVAKSLANLLPGAVTGNARVETASNTWIAGVYTSELAFLAPGLLGGNVISPPTQSATITIPAFISPQPTIGPTQFIVDNLSYFRSVNGISTNKSVSLASTVPYIPNIQTIGNNFAFSTNLPYNNLPNTPVAMANATLTGITNATAITLSAAPKALTTTLGIPVPTINSQTLDHSFSITGEQLKTGFVQAGNYTVPLTYTYSKLSSSYPSGTLQTQRNGTLEVVVSDLGELIANQQAVNLRFTTTSHYVNGVSQDMPAHLKISKTTPYNLYVRATTENFASGPNTIPLSVMKIGPMNGQTGMNTISLSTTAQQLIQAADPVIDRLLNIKYSIPATETDHFLNKPPGTYSTSIIFSFVAP